MIQLLIIVLYLAALLGLGLFSNRLFRGTAADYMLASHSIGPFFLLMSLFGTTMTAFALVGSTGKAFTLGIGVYGMLASASGIMHSLCFFLVGLKLWSLGRRYGYSTQIQFFRDRLDSEAIGLLLFPVLVALVIPYLLVGVISAGAVISEVSGGAFQSVGWFAGSGYGLPPWLASLVVCLVVLAYVFFGGMRGTAWANAFQTMVFMILGIITFFTIANGLGGTGNLLENMRTATSTVDDAHLTRERLSKPVYFSFLLIPLSVAMFPHVFQHWLTARSASAFKLPIVAHPIFIMIVWLPCVLIGIWASAPGVFDQPVHPNDVLAALVAKMAGPVLGGMLAAGILAAIMSSLDSQFLCLGTMFTTDIVAHYIGRDRISDKARVLLARCFVVAIVALTYFFSLFPPSNVFDLGIWCFSGFVGLFPLVIAAIYWRGLTAAGAASSVLATTVAWAVMFVRADFARNPRYAFPEAPVDVAGIFSIPPFMPVVSLFVLATIVLVVVSLVTKPPSQETIARFIRSQ